LSLFATFTAHVNRILDELSTSGSLAPGLPRGNVTVEPPRDPSHGDLSTNAAMVLAKPAGTNPRALAALLVPALEAIPGVTEVQIAGPGFINLRMDEDVWREELRRIAAEGASYGLGDIGQGRRVNVEYVSANPTGPMHMGHCRGAVWGDALARLLSAAGFAVTKEYYVNDAGAQVDTLARSAHLRYREALGEAIGDIPEGLYPGEYLKPVGALLAAEYGTAMIDAPEGEWLKPFREKDGRGDARPHPPRPRPARRPPRPLLVRGRGGRLGRRRPCARRAAREGPRLRRRARSAQGQAPRIGSPSS
jgi:arginyl-tRNA synthetase